MDELEFRRRVYADPQSDDPQILQEIQSDPNKKALLKELRELDSHLQQASKVEVPDDLANKLIWQGSISDFNAHKRRSRRHLALAASIAFMFGLSFLVWQQQSSPANLGSAALAHMNHAEIPADGVSANVSLQHINNKLAAFGATLVSEIGEVKSANYCHLKRIQSLHLILETSAGLVSVFVLPLISDTNIDQSFANQRFAGEKLNLQHANVLVVGEKGQDLSAIKAQVEQTLLFSA